WASAHGNGVRGKLRANGDHAWGSKTERLWIAPPALVTAANSTAEVSQASITNYDKLIDWSTSSSVVPAAGFEPARAFAQTLVKPPRLPFRHAGTERLRTMTGPCGLHAAPHKCHRTACTDYGR